MMEYLWHVSVAEINVNPSSGAGCKDGIYKFTGLNRLMW
ncbi:MAG: hypothetical protein JWP37_3506 [Mucilaginibacter sp.]|nr:hypothetical protein [Mucilaginibacter sp.]